MTYGVCRILQKHHMNSSQKKSSSSTVEPLVPCYCFLQFGLWVGPWSVRSVGVNHERWAPPVMVGWRLECRGGWQVLSDGVKTTMSGWVPVGKQGWMDHLMPPLSFLFKVKRWHHRWGDGVHWRGSIRGVLGFSFPSRHTHISNPVQMCFPLCHKSHFLHLKVKD